MRTDILGRRLKRKGNLFSDILITKNTNTKNL